MQILLTFMTNIATNEIIKLPKQNKSYVVECRVSLNTHSLILGDFAARFPKHLEKVLGISYERCTHTNILGKT